MLGAASSADTTRRIIGVPSTGSRHLWLTPAARAMGSPPGREPAMISAVKRPASP